MADRRERIILEVEDRASRGFAQAAVSAKAFETAVSSIGGSSRKVGADIDSFSGRLSVLVKAAAAIGPAIAPLGGVAAAGVGVLASQLGFAATGAASLIVAAQGVGDALEAVQKANLEPTAENILAAQQAMAQLAPAAREFVTEFDKFRPVLRDIQQSAATGWFPGLTESLDSLAVVGPRVADIFEAIGEAGGRLAAEGAEALTGSQWVEFFTFVEAQAPIALETLGRSVGNVGTAFVELWQAFNPLTTDFNDFLLDSTRAFAEFSAGISETQGFADFVSYVRESGPQVASALGAIATATVQIVQAAAPFGGPVLAGIESFANAAAKIADSPLGTPLIGLASGLSAVSLASSALSKGLSTAQGSLDNIGHGAGRTSAALGKLESAVGKAGAAFATLYVAGATMDMIEQAAAGAAPSVERLTEAMVAQDSAAFADEFGGSLSEALEAVEALDSGAYGLGGSLNELGDKYGTVGSAASSAIAALVGSGAQFSTASEQTKALEQAFGSLDETLVNIANTAGAGEAEAYFSALAESQGLTASQIETLRAQLPGFSSAMSEAGSATLLAADGIKAAGAAAAGIGSNLSAIASDAAEIGGAFDDAKRAAYEFQGAMKALAGYLDRREALRGYEEDLRTLGKSLRNGFTRKDAENLDAVGRSILQVAENMKDPRLRDNFLRNAKQSLLDMAEGAGPRARAEIERLIEFLDRLGAKNPKPKIGVAGVGGALKDVDSVGAAIGGLDKRSASPRVSAAGVGGALSGIKSVGAAVGNLDKQSANPRVTAAGVGGAIGGIQSVAAALSNLDGDSATVTIFRKVTGPTVGGAFGTTSADGGSVPKTGLPYADRHPYLLADGEEVISNRHGQADRHRSLLKAINANALAEGGTAGQMIRDTYARTRGLTSETRPRSLDAQYFEFRGFNAEARNAKDRLRDLNKALKLSEKAVSEERSARDAIISRADSIRSSWRSNYQSDPFAMREGNGNIWSDGGGAAGVDPLAVLSNDIASLRRANELRAQLSARGLDGLAFEDLMNRDGSALEALARLSDPQLAQYERDFNERERLTVNYGGAAANAATGAELRAQTAILQSVLDENRQLRKEAKVAERQRDRAEKRADQRAEQGRKNDDKNTKELAAAYFKAPSFAKRNARG